MPHEHKPGTVGANGPAGAFHLGRVLSLSAGHAVHDTYTAFLPPLLPVFIANLSLSTTQAGALSLFMQLPSLAQPLIGHLADRYNLRILVALGIGATAVMMTLLGVASGYWALALCLIAVGLSSASLHAVGPVMAGHLSGRRLGQGMGLWMVGGELGRTLGPVVLVSVVGWLGLKRLPVLMAAGLLAALILGVALRHTPVRAAGAAVGLPWRQALAGMGPLMVSLAGILVFSSFTLAALSTFLPTLLSHEGASLWLAGVSLSLLEGAGVVGALLGGALSDRLGRRRMLTIAMLSTSLLTFAFLAIHGWLRLPLLLLLGLTGLSITPVLMAVAQESLPDSRALANGLFQATSFATKAVALLALGAVGDHFGLPTAFAASAVVLLAALPLVLRLPGERVLSDARSQQT